MQKTDTEMSCQSNLKKKNVEPKLCIVENSKSREQINRVATDEESPYLDLCVCKFSFVFCTIKQVLILSDK